MLNLCNKYAKKKYENDIYWAKHNRLEVKTLAFFKMLMR